jgi:hypothetical protein
MAIEKVEQLEDRVKFTLWFQNGCGIHDETLDVEILYSAIPNLPSEPPLGDERVDDERYWAVSVDVPKVGARIVYHFREWQETCMARMQGIYGGPYLADLNPAQPSPVKSP